MSDGLVMDVFMAFRLVAVLQDPCYASVIRRHWHTLVFNFSRVNIRQQNCLCESFAA